MRAFLIIVLAFSAHGFAQAPATQPIWGTKDNLQLIHYGEKEYIAKQEAEAKKYSEAQIKKLLDDVQKRADEAIAAKPSPSPIVKPVNSIAEEAAAKLKAINANRAKHAWTEADEVLDSVARLQDAVDAQNREISRNSDLLQESIDSQKSIRRALEYQDDEK